MIILYQNYMRNIIKLTYYGDIQIVPKFVHISSYFLSLSKRDGEREKERVRERNKEREGERERNRDDIEKCNMLIDWLSGKPQKKLCF